MRSSRASRKQVRTRYSQTRQIFGILKNGSVREVLTDCYSDLQLVSRQSRLLTFLEWIAVFLEFSCNAGLVAVEEIKPNSTLIELDLDDVVYSFSSSYLYS